MGSAGSTIYGHCRRLLIRYNAENRAYKFLDKGNLPPAPRHPVSNKKEIQIPKEELEALHEKNEQLNEYLKKVYLTSTSQITGTPSTRPKPKKENEIFKKKRFFEPDEPAPGCCTLTNVVEILVNVQNDPDKWSVNAIADKYNLDKRDTVNLLIYHSLFKRENLEFMHDKPVKTAEPKIEMEINERLEKKPLKKIGAH